MSVLLRELAPISEAAWKQIDEEARRTLKVILAGRKLVDFVGPLGWQRSAINLGHSEAIASPGENVEARLRRVQPLVELRIPFELARSEVEDIDRGNHAPDLQAVIDAARSAGLAEDRAIFHGFAAAGIVGIDEAAEQPALTLTDNYERYPQVVATALSNLRNAGVAGPYAIALGPRCYKGLSETTTAGGFRIYDHVRRLLDGGPVVWAPALDGAAVLSLRGGDFELTVGQDMSIGYLEHTRNLVRLYIQESFTFRVLSGEAAVALTYATKSRTSARRQRSAAQR